MVGLPTVLGRMPMSPEALERLARAYVAAVEGGATGDDLARFYHVDVVQHEAPNRLNPVGAQRGLPEILEAAEAGARNMSRQLFDIHTVTTAGDRVVLEFSWTGYLSRPVGMTKAGEPMRADICQVIEFEDGLIIRQRTYDCFEPF
jgi:ketosteroid isomerase-like protein